MGDRAATTDLLWWDPERRAGEAHAAVAALVDRLEPEREERETWYELYRQVFSDCPADLGAQTTDAYDSPLVDSEDWAGEITTNGVRSMVSAVLSKTVKSKPIPAALTKRGDWKLHTQAQQLNQYIEGDFEDGEVFDVTAMAALDAEIYGLGALKTYETGGDYPDVVTEQVYPGNIYVDPVDGRYMKPRVIGYRELYDREHLRALYPEHSDAIDETPRASLDALLDEEPETDSDMVFVYEFWRLPSRKGSKDGRHFLGVTNATFVDEPYERDHFPMRFIRWMPEPGSFWGRGLVAEAMPIQGEINALARHIQESHYRGANFLWWLPNDAQIDSDRIDNLPGTIVRGTQPPVKLTGPTIDGEVYQHYDRLWSKMFQIAGVSEMMAGSMKPAGLDSGKALRTYADLGTERFAWFSQQYERLHLDVAADRIEAASEAQEREGSKPRRVFSKSRAWVDEVDFPDLEESQYRLRITPVNAVSDTISGRINDVEQLIQIGVISDPIEIRRMLRLPDNEADNELHTAPRDVIDWAVHEILYGGDAIECEPEWDATLAKKIAKLYLAAARPYKPPEDRTEALREFIRSADAVLQKAAAMTSAGPAASAAPPMPPLPPGGEPPMPGAPMPPVNATGAPGMV